MEVIKIQATIKGGILPIPDRILSQIGEGENVEIVFRPLRSDASTGKDVNQVIDDLEKQFQGEFPNLRSPISHRIRAVAGLSRDMNRLMSKYTDKEILAMARMEKYLEKGEIIESLY